MLLAAAAATRHDRVLGASETPEQGGAEVDVTAGCEQLTRLLLTAQLVQVVRGRADGGPEVAESDVPAAVVARAERVDAELLRTAAGDLLGPFGRDVRALVAAYQPRIVLGCAHDGDG